ncbi:MAG: OpgC domain-containing protein [Azospirillaceae bacterium]
MARGPTGRDPRLDFFRGIAMFIILIAHVPGNYWGRFIPARFGPSDATEMFVFCSGFAAAIAFGGTFVRAGFLVGCLRIVYRCWQIYWAHIGVFFVIATICFVATQAFVEPDYVRKLNLTRFFEDPGRGLVGLFTLTYVPNYFDILPMYFVVLLMTPILIALKRLHIGAAIAFSVGLYLAVWLQGIALPAEWWSDRPWFFNPFAWQLLFFTGFALSAGWIKAPPANRWLTIAAVAWVVLMIPLHWGPIWRDSETLQAIYALVGAERMKTNFHWLRYLHFLALAYLAVVLLKGREQALLAPVFAPILKVGQQALATFMAGMVFSWCAGIFLDQVGRSFVTTPAVNLVGFAWLIAVAYTVAWYKATPWKRRPAEAAAPRDGREAERPAASGPSVPRVAARTVPAGE